ncbi:NUDIX domain-containing protein [Halovivax cerinus]|uniref:NUDIX domain-containing protein n=1 Tax=Halovivax cerinus TaxID=1487865 RepID=A0ABD5NQK1_9EURY|nr:NUDIX domain-containing protein [Halovivax cerinus]
MTTHVNRSDVEARLARLCERYESVPVVETDTAVPPARFDRLLDRAREGYTGGAYAWIVREPTDAPPLSTSMPDESVETGPVVCLIQHRGDEDRWRLPGGGREDGETSEEAVVREVAEETNLTIDVDAPFLCYRETQTPDDAREIYLHTLWICFDATYASGHLDILVGELRGAAWLTDPPRDLGPWAQFRGVDWWETYTPPEPWWEVANPDPYALVA